MHAEELKVLLVEDDDADADLATGALEESTAYQFVLTRVHRLDEARARLQASAFDVVLLDLSLPDSQGIETFRELKPMAHHLPIVVLSGFNDQAAALDAVAEGAQDYLVKSCTPAEMLARSIRYALERKRIMDELVRSRNAALAASRAKSAFLANMSHEIRTPLNGIIGMAQVLIEEVAGTERQGKLALIKRSAEALLGILSDVLDLARIESGTLAIVPGAFSLAELVQDIADLMAPRAREKGLSLSTALPSDLPEPLRGDALRIRQVLLNLVGNAVKFTEQGRIEIVATVGPAAAAGQVRVGIAVRDTGIGIPRDRLAAIFERFTQADLTTERRFGGTGLGLSISSELARLLGGRLTVQSTPGRGSTFLFELDLDLEREQALERNAYRTPTTRAHAPHADRRTRTREPRTTGINAARQVAGNVTRLPRPLRILVAEDYEANRIVVEKLLTLLGCTVQSVADGRQAVDAMTRGPYDLVLMDIQMPVMDGLSAAAAIRSMETASGGYTPILAYTAHSQEEEFQRCLDAGMDAVLTKPIQLDDLTVAIVRWAETARPPRQAGPASPERRSMAETVSRSWSDTLLERCLGDSRLAREVLRTLLDSIDEPLSRLERALAAKHTDRVKSSAHALKGLFLTVGADEEAATCRALEQAALHSDLSRARELAAAVHDQWRSLQVSIRDFLRSAP